MTLRLTVLALAAVLTACQAAPPASLPVASPTRTLLQANGAPEVKSGAEDREDLSLTVYQDDLGLVSDTRALRLPSGRVLLRIEDVAPQMDGTSATFRALEGGVRLLEQQFVSAPITSASLLERYVGKEVEVRIPAEGESPARIVKAILISADGPVVRIGDRVYLQPPGQVILPDVPEDLATHPSLLASIEVDRGGEQDLQLSYLTTGLSWSADYQLTLPPTGAAAALKGWVTLRNTSGLTYPEAQLTVVAGDIGRVRPSPPYPMPVDARDEATEAGAPFTPGTVFEYHRYDLERRATVENGQTRQISLLEAGEVPLTRTYTFDSFRLDTSTGTEQPVEVTLATENTAANRLGKPLPKGVVRIYETDAQGALRLIGEAALPHTAVDGPVRLQAGKAFDVVGTRRQTAVKQVSETVREESYEVVLRNQKAEAIAVEVIEHPYGAWELIAQSHPHVARNANEVVFTVPVPARGRATLTFTWRFTVGR